jgi:hypothetical protein
LDGERRCFRENEKNAHAGPPRASTQAAFQVRRHKLGSDVEGFHDDADTIATGLGAVNPRKAQV